MKKIKLQHKTYLGADRITKYIQHRINIPDNLIQNLGWKNDDQTILQIRNHTKNKRKIPTLKLKTDNA